MNLNKQKIIPFCKQHPGAFIEFTGLVTPCCWLITDKTRHDDLKNFMGEEYQKIFITNSKEEIIEAYKKIEESWQSDRPFRTCERVCGEHSESHPLNRIL
jgi:hypothetical protein